MTKPTPKLTRVSDAVATMLTQFQDSPVQQAWVISHANLLQELENQIIAVWVAFLLDDAEGDQLDILGNIVGEPRAGRDDDAYRIAIGSRIRINRGNGTIENILGALTGASDTGYGILELWPASMNVTSLGTITEDMAAGLYRALQDASGAGIGASLTWCDFDIDNAVTFASGDVEEDSTTQGLADDAETVGGYLMGYFND